MADALPGGGRGGPGWGLRRSGYCPGRAGLLAGGAMLIVIGLLAGWTSPAPAADECFCLVHKAGAILRGCEAYRAPHDYYSTARCVDPLSGVPTEQIITGDWERLAEGADRCDPCRPQTRAQAPTLPRGDEDQPASPAAQDPPTATENPSR